MKIIRYRIHRLVITAIVVVACLLVSTGLGLRVIQTRKSNVLYRITSFAEFQLKRSIEKYVSYTSNWNAILLANEGAVNQQMFDAVSRNMFEQYNDPSIRCIQLAPGGIIRYAYPLDGFESAIGGDLFSGHRAEECRYARDTGKPTMSGPYELTQGGISCVLRAPLYIKGNDGTNTFWGFSIVVLNYPQMLSDVDFESESRFYDFKLSHISEETGLEEVILESSDKELSNPVSVRFNVPNTQWMLSATWKGGWIPTNEFAIELAALMVVVTLAYVVITMVISQKENDVILAALSNEYVSVFGVDVQRRELTVFKLADSTDADMLPLLKRGKYTQIHRRYVNHDVDPDFQEEFKQFTILDNMVDRLRKVPNYSCIFRTQHGKYVEIKIVRADANQRGAPKRILLGFADRDEATREEMARRKDLRIALQRAESASRVKSEFLSNMSHDIRTPMNSIVGFTEFALRHLDRREEVNDCLKKISLASEQLLAIINDVLDMSVIESGKWEFKNDVFSIKAVKGNLVSIFAMSAHKKKIHLSIDDSNVSHDLVYGDVNCIERILMNIVSNAIKYTEMHGKVDVRIKEQNTQSQGVRAFRFTVQDNGIGMSQEFLDRIFEPFERERSSLSRRRQGTGLGMAIVRNLVERMNGTIEIDSQLGIGTMITIEIPLKVASGAEPADDVQETETAAISFEGKRILIVDDVDMNRELASMILRDRQIEVDEARNGKEAVELFKKDPERYDAILMDVQMPVMDGSEASKAIRAEEHPRAQTIPIIAMTANAFAEDRAKAFCCGMNDYVIKPIDVADLFNTLGRYL